MVTLAAARVGTWWRWAPTLLGLAACNHISRHIDLGLIWPAMAAMMHLPTLRWTAIVLCCALSIFAMSRFDVLTHRLLGSNMPERKAALAGCGALLVTQFAGAGPVLAPLLRWWAMPERGLAFAVKLVGTMFIAFGCAIAVITAIVSLGQLYGGLVALAALGLIAVMVATLPPAWRAFCSGMLLYTAVDLLAVSTALWLILAPDMHGFTAFLPYFAAGWLSGMISAIPGGLGGLDMVLLQALPHMADADILAALMLWRLALITVPVVVAPILLVMARRSPDALPNTAADIQQEGWSPLAHAPLLKRAPAAECGLLRMPGMRLLRVENTAMLSGRSLWGEVALFDPFQGRAIDLACRLRARGISPPLFYKLSATHAAPLHRAGFATLRIAEEAVLRLEAGFDLNTPAKRQLRRKLRAAQKAGLSAQTGPFSADTLNEMASIDAEWCTANGGAHGFSMGRFHPKLLTNQYVVRIFQEDRLIAFASFHQSDQEWALDLMRKTDDCPDGAMYLAVYTAIVAAIAAKVPRLSLAAVPSGADHLDHPIGQKLWARLLPTGPSNGLRRFKTCFDPAWEPRFAVAASPARLGLGLLGVFLAVRFPDLPQRLWPRGGLIKPAPDLDARGADT